MLDSSKAHFTHDEVTQHLEKVPHIWPSIHIELDIYSKTTLITMTVNPELGVYASKLRRTGKLSLTEPYPSVLISISATKFPPSKYRCQCLFSKFPKDKFCTDRCSVSVVSKWFNNCNLNTVSRMFGNKRHRPNLEPLTNLILYYPLINSIFSSEQTHLKGGGVERFESMGMPSP